MISWLTGTPVMLSFTILWAGGFWVQWITDDPFLRTKARRGLTLALLGLVGVLYSAIQPFPDLVKGLEWVLLTGLLDLASLLLLNSWWRRPTQRKLAPVVQDAIMAAAVSVAASLLFPERLLATSALTAVILGLALQDTLGNLLAGLTLQIEKPFSPGHWVLVGKYEGRVSEVSWRATKLLTKDGNLIVLPNLLVSKEAIVNYSEPQATCRFEVSLRLPYALVPGNAADIMLSALRDVPQVLTEPKPEVLLKSFEDFSLGYLVRFWSKHLEADEPLRSSVRSAIWYALRRAGVSTPIPEQRILRQEPPPVLAPRIRSALAQTLRRVDLFAQLGRGQLQRLCQDSRELLFAPDQAIVRAGDSGDSLFVLLEGSVLVQTPSGIQLAALSSGDYFGEMSFLTGEARVATVKATETSVVLEVPSDAFRPLVQARPELLQRITHCVARRSQDMAARVASAQVSSGQYQPKNLLARITEFLLSPISVRTQEVPDPPG